MLREALSRLHPPIREDFNERLIATRGEIVKEHHFLVADDAVGFRHRAVIPCLRFVMVQYVVVTKHVDLHEPCASDRALAKVGAISALTATLEPSPTRR